jgi:hypothetical protein
MILGLVGKTLEAKLQAAFAPFLCRLLMIFPASGHAARPDGKPFPGQNSRGGVQRQITG